jgi:Fe-S cluster assembly protein SufA/iron-sulfur cluster assembly protein
MTVSTFDPSASGVSVTKDAQEHFKKMLGNNNNQMVRLSTKASGCSGYAYVLDTVDGPEPTDEVIHLDDNLTFLVADEAKPFVQMTEIDFVYEGINGVIKFNNPNVVNECGCGESFNIG